MCGAKRSTVALAGARRPVSPVAGGSPGGSQRHGPTATMRSGQSGRGYSNGSALIYRSSCGARKSSAVWARGERPSRPRTSFSPCRETVEVAFPEQPPFETTGPLILFNGAERGGAVTLFVYTYVAVPAPTAVVSTATLTRQRKGPYGLHSVIDIPRIAGGAGSFVRGNIQARRLYTYKGERRSVLSGRCPDLRILAKGTFHFRSGPPISGNVVRPCTGI